MGTLHGRGTVHWKKEYLPVYVDVANVHSYELMMHGILAINKATYVVCIVHSQKIEIDNYHALLSRMQRGIFLLQ